MSATIVDAATFRLARRLRDFERLALRRPAPPTAPTTIDPEHAVVLPPGHPALLPRGAAPARRTPSAVLTGDTVRVVAPLGNGRTGYARETEWCDGTLWVTVQSAGVAIRVQADLLEVVR